MTIIRDGEYTSIEEMVLPFRELLTPFAMFTASEPPGVLWHCVVCREHEVTTTLLAHPKHCKEWMEVELWTSIYEYFRSA